MEARRRRRRFLNVSKPSDLAHTGRRPRCAARAPQELFSHERVGDVVFPAGCGYVIPPAYLEVSAPGLASRVNVLGCDARRD